MDYQLIDSGDKRRLEKYGKFLIDRPDPEAMWSKTDTLLWEKADARFVNDNWQTQKSFPQDWIISVMGLKVKLKLTPFKHTGIFPEQHFEWQIIEDQIKKDGGEFKMISLFGYTGVSSLVGLKNGARVTHIDASRPSIAWFKENLDINQFEQKPIRYIIEDVLKFVQREIKRGNKYDGIIMDPPVYGHGPRGEKWSFDKNFQKLLDDSLEILTDDPKFLIINAYAVSTSHQTLRNMLIEKMDKFKGSVSSGELELTDKSGRTLTTGIYALWQK